MDVLVFQMGKVGSSAITRALRMRGVEAVQTHWLGRETLVGTLEQSLLNVETDPSFEIGGVDEFIQNIENTRKLYWYRRYKQRDGHKLKIITLARDPLDWYWGHLAENFGFYENEIRNWYGQVSGESPAGLDIVHATRVFHEALFTHFGSIRRSIDHPRFDAKAAKQRFRGVHVPFLPQQIMKLRLPTAWYDVFFRPETGIDVYREPFDRENGVAEFENDFARVLLIRYEDLDGALDAIGRFTGLDNFELERINVSSEKQTGIDLGAIRSSLRPSERALQKIYGSRYCRHFAYDMSG